MRPEIIEKIKQIANLPAEEQSAALNALLKSLSKEEIEELQKIGLIKKESGCVFCRIVSGQIPARVVYSDEHFIAFLDINPAAPAHTLLVPKKHIESITKLPSDVAARLGLALKKVSDAVIRAVDAQGLNVIQNNGAVAGQLVPHIHFHLIPRFENDKLKFEWVGLKMSSDQLDELARRIKNQFKEEKKEKNDHTPLIIKPRIP